MVQGLRFIELWAPHEAEASEALRPPKSRSRARSPNLRLKLRVHRV